MTYKIQGTIRNVTVHTINDKVPAIVQYTLPKYHRKAGRIVFYRITALTPKPLANYRDGRKVTAFIEASQRADGSYYYRQTAITFEPIPV
ncbi:MAG: hypothetical protein QNK37_37235 [Acidobacteriota bacterium]|nr:hypothetical protein [Acidobacteriota bacterium]